MPPNLLQNLFWYRLPNIHPWQDLINRSRNRSDRPHETSPGIEQQQHCRLLNMAFDAEE